MFCELNWNAYTCTSGAWGNCGGRKKALDLNDATTFDAGQANDEPCFAPRRNGSVRCACFVANSVMEWCLVSVTHSAYS